jgi:hypothetical protein
MDSLWEPDVSFDVSPEVLRPEAVRSEVKPEVQEEQPTPEPAVEQTPETTAEPVAVALSADEFTALEERILRAVALVKRERGARTEAEERAVVAEARLTEQTTGVELLEKEVTALKAERDHVRERVERLLAELDALEL